MPSLPLEPTPENISKAKRFAAAKYADVARKRNPLLARDHPELIPTDLSGGYRYAALFAYKLFGGIIRGSQHHLWLVCHGKKIDLCGESGLTKAIGKKAQWHNPQLLKLKSHADSLKSCLPRVNEWVEEFLSQLDGQEQGLNEDYEFHPALDPFEPRKMEEPKVLYRSVSLPELEDIFETGEVRGGGNRFNTFEHRPWVFFGDQMTDQLVAQGEEVERQAHHSMRQHFVHYEYRKAVEQIEQLSGKALTLLKSAGVELDDGDQYNVREGTHYTYMQLVWKIPDGERRQFLSLGDKLGQLNREADELKKRYQDDVTRVAQGMQAMATQRKATSAIIVTKPLSGGLHYSKDFGRSAFHTDEYGFHSGQVKDSDIAQVIFVKDGKRVASAPPERAREVLHKILGVG